MMYKALKELYRRGKIDKAGLAKAITDGLITPAQYELITGEPIVEV